MNNNVPDLGMPASAKVGFQPMALIRHLDADGTITRRLVQTQQGPQAPLDRADFMTADELLDAVEELTRRVVREELSNAVSYILQNLQPTSAHRKRTR